ncbi:MAG: hypothetical protein ACTS6A_00275 [Candidatus Hodgkinia cicadicola]
MIKFCWLWTKPVILDSIDYKNSIKLIDNFRVLRRINTNDKYLYIGIACKVNVVGGRNVSFVFIDNWSYVAIDILSPKVLIQVGYKSKLQLNVNSILKNLMVTIGPKSKLIVITNGVLKSFDLNLNLKLMNRSEVQISTNIIAALNYVSFVTNALALEQFTNVKLVYNVIILKQSSLNLSPSFELRGKNTKCVHSIFIGNKKDNDGYISNRLITPEIINALMFYANCTT